jgi:methylated-DNA-[protein]-cysteine S-methyltransferase
VTVWASPEGLRRIEFGPLPEESHVDPHEAWTPFLRRAVTELNEYFDGERQAFDMPLDLEAATDFQREVYRHLMGVAYGHVTTYGELATAIGRPELARAVGQAVGANPVPIVIPCHRVIAAEGRLGGFSGGLETKVALLRLEGVSVDGSDSSSHVHPEVISLDL